MLCGFNPFHIKRLTFTFKGITMIAEYHWCQSARIFVPRTNELHFPVCRLLMYLSLNWQNHRNNSLFEVIRNLKGCGCELTFTDFVNAAVQCFLLVYTNQTSSLVLSWWSSLKAQRASCVEHVVSGQIASAELTESSEGFSTMQHSPVIDKENLNTEQNH